MQKYTIMLLSLLNFSVLYGMNNLRNDLAHITHHAKRGFKAGLDTSIYLHTYQTASKYIPKFKSHDELNSLVIVGAPYLLDQIGYFENENQNVTRTFSYMWGYALGIAIGYTSIANILKSINS